MDETDSETLPAGPMQRRQVSMSNALTRAAHNLSLAEKRILIAAVSAIDSRKAPPAYGAMPSVKITAGQFAEAYGIDSATAYQQLAAAGRNLFERSITFFEPAFKRSGKPLPPTRVTMRWVGLVKYQSGEGWIELAFMPQLMQHLMGLKKQFTSYQLSQVSALRSVHSWKLLELLSRFESTGWAEYTVEDFAESMEASEKQRADFGKLRTQLIEPAIKELVAKDGWQIKLDLIKAGRRVVRLHFEFQRSPQRSLL